MFRAILFATFVLLVGAGCSGSSDSTSTDSKVATTAAKAAATSAAASSGSGAATTPAKAATATASTPAAAVKSGGAATDACSLITAAEVGQVMGVTGVTVENQPEVAGASYCMYKGADGSIIVATSFLRAGAPAFNAFAASAQAQSGLGDKALWETSTAALMILKGQTVLSITAGDGSMPLARRLELSRQLGALGVARQ